MRGGSDGTGEESCHLNWMDWTYVQKRREGSVICSKGVTGWQVGAVQ